MITVRKNNVVGHQIGPCGHSVGFGTKDALNIYPRLHIKLIYLVTFGVKHKIKKETKKKNVIGIKSRHQRT